MYSSVHSSSSSSSLSFSSYHVSAALLRNSCCCFFLFCFSVCFLLGRGSVTRPPGPFSSFFSSFGFCWHCEILPPCFLVDTFSDRSTHELLFQTAQGKVATPSNTFKVMTTNKPIGTVMDSACACSNLLQADLIDITTDAKGEKTSAGVLGSPASLGLS
mmetsp:Transcript_39923/g.97887  ORF Transcript_39923/g.97887 Transcript_39923/m.97887 type:complete len:159 (+) Transcript_39923:949-1425(+)